MLSMKIKKKTKKKQNPDNDADLITVKVFSLIS